MFKLEYSYYPGDSDVYFDGETFEDQFEANFEEKAKAFDQFIYLIDMYLIIKDCFLDFRDTLSCKQCRFRDINKGLLNYVNSIYSHKQYVESYRPSLKNITNEYHEHKQWYGFICEYRNRIIHQSTLIKNYNPKSGDAYINLDELIELQNAIIAGAKNQKFAIGAQKFQAKLSELASSDIVESHGKRYRSIMPIFEQANEEIDTLNTAILHSAYDQSVMPALKWMMAHIKQVQGSYMYTYYVNHENREVFEPSYTLDYFFHELTIRLDCINAICKDVESFMIAKNYQPFDKFEKT